MMDMEKLIKMASQSGSADRFGQGQQSLGYLIDILSLCDPTMWVQWDTGANFGLAPIEWDSAEPIKSEYYSHSGFDVAESETAYPSCYRGYYSDLTFNCKPEYAAGTVAHVLEMCLATVGKSFDGYKGGVNEFDRGTEVWGGVTSWASTGDSRMLVGFHLDERYVILETKEEAY